VELLLCPIGGNPYHKTRKIKREIEMEIDRERESERESEREGEGDERETYHEKSGQKHLVVKRVKTRLIAVF